MVISEGSYGILKGWQHRYRRQNEVDLSQIPDQTGKTALITGANSGIGKVATEVLASKGAKVFMACRSPTKCDVAINKIRISTPSIPASSLEFVAYNASSLPSIHTSITSLLSTHPDLHLDILLLNAGAIVGSPTTTEDGLEYMFGVNHMSHFLLTILLLPALKRAATAPSPPHGDVRIAATTSAGFPMHPDPTSLHLDDAEIFASPQDNDARSLYWKDTMPMYGRSKTCNILFTRHLSALLNPTNPTNQATSSPQHLPIFPNSLHPGTVATSLNAPLRSSYYYSILESLTYALASIPTDAGATNMLYCATSPEVRERGVRGEYVTPYGYVNGAAVAGRAAGDERLAGLLWERSWEIVGRVLGVGKVGRGGM